jgi:hypothetical protein
MQTRARRGELVSQLSGALPAGNKPASASLLEKMKDLFNESSNERQCTLQTLSEKSEILYQPPGQRW